LYAAVLAFFVMLNAFVDRRLRSAMGGAFDASKQRRALIWATTSESAE
jgi:hypothetical protein